MKALRITLWVLLGIVVVVIAALAIFVATFDANRYKPEIQKLVFDQTGRTLQIQGNIHLTLWPNIGAELGRATISDKDPGQAFLTIDSTRVSVALMPLLSGQVLVDGVAIDGLAVHIKRDKGGTFNFDDLLSKTNTGKPDASEPTVPPVPSASVSSLKLDISSIALTDATIKYNDLQDNTDLQISALNLKTGRIAPNSTGQFELSAKVQSKSLQLNAALNAIGDYKLDLPKQRFEVSKLSTKFTGDYQDIKSIDSRLDLNLVADLLAGAHTFTKIDGKLKANSSGQLVDLSLKTDQASVSEQQVAMATSALTLSLKGEARSIEAALKLPAFAFAHEQLALEKFTAAVSVSDPALGKQPLKLATNGDLSVNTKSETIKASLAGQLDDSPINASIGVNGFKTPAITFDLALDQLKLDRFAAAPPPVSQSASAPGAGNTVNAGGTATPIDLSALKGHNVRGKLRIGKIQSKGLAIEQVQADVTLAQGKLAVSPHSAQLFGGKLAGSLTVDANTNQFALKENISGIRLESLLTALGQAPRVTGQGAVTLDLSSAGNTVKALEQNLAGTANVNLKDGAIKGIDIGAIINNVRSMLGKAPTQQGSGSGETAFTEMTASATIQKGIATNRDLNVKAPLFRLEGAGTINIPQSSLDYLAKVAVVESSTGQGGQNLASLRGVTIPIKISGKFDNPQYSVDVGSLAAELAKSQLGDKAKEEINKVVPGLGDALKGLFGR